LYFVKQRLRRNEYQIKLAGTDETGYEDVDFTHLAQKKNQQRPLISSDEAMGTTKLGNFLTG
jgi:hypothetical protein